MTVEHRLAAILSADVVGYSRLMADDEAGTIRTLTDYRDAVSTRVAHHRGRVVDAPGDNLLAEFPSAQDAVRCAIETQAVLGALNASLASERRMEFRIGIHLGDVAAEGERIYGDGVNIAARLEGLAEAGGICISGAVCDQVESRLDVELEDLGEQDLKNIPKPVRAHRLRPAQSSAGEPAPSAAALTVPGFAGRPAIAVLPFDNLSADPDQEYFADGIAEDLITRLSGWRLFPVIARNSSFVYKGQAVDVKRVSRELGVRYVVEGSVRKAGDRVRTTAQLIDATSGHHVWAERYDRKLEDVFSLQDEITQAILEGIEPRVREYEIERASHRDPRSLDAWDLAQRAIWHSRQMTREQNLKSLELLERSLELDPDSVFALFGLAVSHYMALYLNWSDPPEQSVAELVRAAKRASAIDPKDPFAQLALTMAFSVTGPPEKMLEAGMRALELNPNLVLGYFFVGNFFALVERPEEAIENLEKGMRLSPQDPLMYGLQSGMAWAHMAAGRYEESIEWAKRSLQQRGDWVDGWSAIVFANVKLGRTDEARAAVAQLRSSNPDFSLESLKRTTTAASSEYQEHMIRAMREAGME